MRRKRCTKFRRSRNSARALGLSQFASLRSRPSPVALNLLLALRRHSLRLSLSLSFFRERYRNEH